MVQRGEELVPKPPKKRAKSTKASVKKKPSATRAVSVSKKPARKTVSKKTTTRIVKAAATDHSKTVRSKSTARTSKKSVAPITAETTSVPLASPVQTVSTAVTEAKHHVLTRAYMLPVDSMKLMSQVARVSGVVVAVFGLIALWLLSPYVLSNTLQYSNMAAVTDTSTTDVATTTPGTVDDLNSITEPVVTNSQEQSAIFIDQTAPLKGTVNVKVETPNAYKVDIFIFEESWQNKERLGSAHQIDATHWLFTYDTTKLTDGKNYKFSAGVWEYSTDSAVPDFTIQLDYMLVDNTISVSDIVETVNTVSVDETPDVTIVPPTTTLAGLQKIKVAVADATRVSLEVRHLVSGTRNILYDATQLDATHWVVAWNTPNYTDGEYEIRALVKNAYGSYVDGSAKVVVKNTVSTTADASSSSDGLTDTAVDSTEAPLTVDEPVTLIPSVKMRVSDGTTLADTARIEAEVSDGVAKTVYFYVRDLLSTTPRFIGAAQPTSGTRWYLNWYTGNTPNGTYKLFALANSSVGVVQSDVVTITVANKTQSATTPTEALSTITNEVKEVSATTEPLTSPVIASAALSPATTSAAAPTTAVVDSTTADLLQRYRTQFDAELVRLGSALRSGDEAAVERIRARITSLVSAIIAKDPALTEADRARFETEVQAIVERYTEQVGAVTKLLAERQQDAVLRDTDGDGITDYDEVAIYNTDPTVADTDNDGFVDGAEVLAGFDPLSDTRESVIVYESPKEQGVFREDVLSVDSVTPVITRASTTVAVTEQTALLLAGRALPSSYVTLYVYSTPVIVTVKTDSEGSWEYRFEQELEDGEHTVYVGITDNAGRVVAKSQPLAFVKEAQAVTPLQAAALDQVVTTETDRSLFVSSYVIYALVSVSLVAIGLVLILLGVHLESRRKVLASSPAV